MALSASTVFEVRTTGSNNNGGGFVTGASGTDWSQQNAAQFALTGVTSGGAGNTVLSASAAASMVGNIAHAISGTNITAGFYQITSVSVGVSITMSTNGAGTSICTGVAASGVINIGGALLTIAQATAIMLVDGMQAYVRGGTYTITTAITLGSLGGTDTRARLIGYSTARGDLGRPIVSITAAVNGLSVGVGWSIENFEVDGTSTGAIGIRIFDAYGTVHNCRVHHCTGVGMDVSGSTAIYQCEIDHCDGGGIDTSSTVIVYGCYVHHNTTFGIRVGNYCDVIRNVVSTNTGATTDGILFDYGTAVIGNVAYGNGRNGIAGVSQAAMTAAALGPTNCICVSNGGYGIAQSVALVSSVIEAIDYNAFYNNTSGARNNLTAGAHDVTLTGDPFVSAATGDFRLNATTGAGAACRAVGFPGTIPGTTGAGALDIGPLQHADVGGGTVEVPAGAMAGV